MQNKLSNIFLRIEGFHMEKVAIPCCCKHLEESGIGTVLIENEIYGPSVVNPVMDDKHWRHKKGYRALRRGYGALTDISFFG